MGKDLNIQSIFVPLKTNQLAAFTGFVMRLYKHKFVGAFHQESVLIASMFENVFNWEINFQVRCLLPWTFKTMTIDEFPRMNYSLSTTESSKTLVFFKSPYRFFQKFRITRYTQLWKWLILLNACCLILLTRTEFWSPGRRRSLKYKHEPDRLKGFAFIY